MTNYTRLHWQCKNCGAKGFVLIGPSDTRAMEQQRLDQSHHAQKRRDRCPTPRIITTYRDKLNPVLPLLLLLCLPSLVNAGPIADAVARQYARPVPATTTTYTTAMQSPALFWSGAALVAGGTTAVIASLTWAQESDLSVEDPNTRLGRDLAPCGTEPSRTRLAVADCKTNVPLQVFGILVSAGGGIMMAVGGQRVQIVAVSPSRIAMRVRW